MIKKKVFSKIYAAILHLVKQFLVKFWKKMR